MSAPDHQLSRTNWWDYARLLRLPNVFTALADAAMGFLLVQPPHSAGLAMRLAAVMLASGLLYLAGMVWNDYFDRHQDALERPGRPLPSGRIAADHARWLAAILTAVGLVVGLVLVGNGPLGHWEKLVPAALAALILAYDATLKHTPAGPLAMGGCRTLNILMASLAAVPAGADYPPASFHLALGAALGMGTYVAGITWFARTEATWSGIRTLIGGTAVMVSGVLLLAALPWLVGPGALLRLSFRQPEIWPGLLAVLTIAPLIRWLMAIHRPEPIRVQRGVKQAIFFLIVLDAALVLAFRTPWASIAVLALLIPAQWLGRWIPST